MMKAFSLSFNYHWKF